MVVNDGQHQRAGWLAWLKHQVVQDVPQDMAVCEFDCRKTQCENDEWATCERRTNNAAGKRNRG
jgi:hypothetical protein